MQENGRGKEKTMKMVGNEALMKKKQKNDR